MDTVIADLADHVADNPSVKVYRIDGSRNEVFHRDILVQGFPSVYVFKSHDRAHAHFYDGERSLAGILEFLQRLELGSNPIAGAPIGEMEIGVDPSGEVEEEQSEGNPLP